MKIRAKVVSQGQNGDPAVQKAGLGMIRLRDLGDFLLVVTLFPVAWVLPEKYWPQFARFLGRLHVAVLGQQGRHLQPILEQYFDLHPYELEIGFRTHNYLDLMSYLREHRPSRWKASISVVGLEHIDTALAKGKGVLLWVSPFSPTDLVTKKGLHEVGYKISHLSQYSHGFQSSTRFGMRFLNPVKTKIEERYLRERCVMEPGRAGAAVRKLIERLRANKIVSITAIQTGHHFAERPFLSGTLQLAKGGPNIALTTGATLLPVFTVPIEGGGYEVNVEAALVPKSENLEIAEEEMVSQYVSALEKHVRRYPESWRGWLGSPNFWQPDADPKLIQPDKIGGPSGG